MGLDLHRYADCSQHGCRPVCRVLTFTITIDRMTIDKIPPSNREELTPAEALQQANELLRELGELFPNENLLKDKVAWHYTSDSDELIIDIDLLSITQMAINDENNKAEAICGKLNRLITLEKKRRAASLETPPIISPEDIGELNQLFSFFDENATAYDNPPLVWDRTLSMARHNNISKPYYTPLEAKIRAVMRKINVSDIYSLEHNDTYKHLWASHFQKFLNIRRARGSYIDSQFVLNDNRFGLVTQL